MGALSHARLALALGLLICPLPLRADPVTRWAEDIAEASGRFGIDRQWVEAVMRAESGGQTIWRGQPITSSAGAMGLMQVMPGTWGDMRRLYGLGSNPHDPHDNIIAGTAYLAAMHARFGYPGLFGAYHAGPARYADYLSAGRPLPPETRAYMTTITAALGTRWAQATSPPKRNDPPTPNPPALFVYHANGVTGGTAKDRPDGDGLSLDPLFALRKRF
ncbi:lytic transglycosylase domain-containing protein [Sphingobium chlorophenolicum]|uniref:Putative lytic transglycosylase n=1 Tax=Sphingobium chlorophenolicum TaxID=46429 RepID=A0A081R9G8_SPHCR|nr:lytic transglycosylase domain-containing protein [Sphingobium chlorophenolicum]KEQ51841.1 putative lytic transglycosylase [Sphingobium chlorophenolicum]